MKLIFLDVDGVLNNRASMKANSGMYNVDEACIECLNQICELTGARCVLSSTWRRGWPVAAFQQFLEKHGFTGLVIDRTRYLSGQERGVEIAMYLEDCRNRGYPVESFVILDDDSDMGPLLDRLVQTATAYGLEDEHVQQAVSRLED